MHVRNRHGFDFGNGFNGEKKFRADYMWDEDSAATGKLVGSYFDTNPYAPNWLYVDGTNKLKPWKGNLSKGKFFENLGKSDRLRIQIFLYKWDRNLKRNTVAMLLDFVFDVDDFDESDLREYGKYCGQFGGGTVSFALQTDTNGVVFDILVDGHKIGTMKESYYGIFRLEDDVLELLWKKNTPQRRKSKEEMEEVLEKAIWSFLWNKKAKSWDDYLEKKEKEEK